MVPGTTSYNNFRCQCGGGTCACTYWTGQTGGVITIYPSTYGSSSTIPAPDLGPRKRQGFQFEVSCAETPVPIKPRAERRIVPTPEVVGAGPMRRRWR